MVFEKEILGAHVLYFLFTDVDLCITFPCVNGGTCQNHCTHYTCECPLGWEGYDCSQRKYNHIKGHLYRQLRY